ncbi:glyoxalase/bleomycin resistance/extradiol dioxygenase family protein [Pseudoxanthomonas daejeonensis]|uniref:PhnB protein n=1 Tax=Pseudoxanthomonas daejeonensis TaxID=266062 RepID=A0ABQ6Z3Q5_9GAMM|nr:glyoxalase/bleomycin resistance/extradiol dioxygenase family protein [Pseudoxanthomonas daejeonensis]KAF1692236.1 hypothetical protein CSC65_14845 [Pseudoxanthomonas daejeonensis]UNK56303.1 glyoxalase/bleomycin resistance/extradiol dioxygenase family protein [Pseudoxanthomonas daejeonensis]
MGISCHLSFDGECAVAFRRYQRILGGEFTTLLTYGESPLARQVPREWQSRILHATLMVDDQELLGSDAFPGTYVKLQGFSVTLHVPVHEAARVFVSLSEGGSIRMPFEPTFWSPGFGMLVDRYGIPWEINGERVHRA